MRTAPWALVCLALGLAGCASPPPPPPAVSWTGGDPSRLAADEKACHDAAAATDINQADTYSDPSLGMANALASKVDEYDPLANHKAENRAAAFESCMTDKGWREQP